MGDIQKMEGIVSIESLIGSFCERSFTLRSFNEDFRIVNNLIHKVKIEDLTNDDINKFCMLAGLICGTGHYFREYAEKFDTLSNYILKKVNT